MTPSSWTASAPPPGTPGGLKPSAAGWPPAPPGASSALWTTTHTTAACSKRPRPPSWREAARPPGGGGRQVQPAPVHLRRGRGTTPAYGIRHGACIDGQRLWPAGGLPPPGQKGQRPAPCLRLRGKRGYRRLQHLRQRVPLLLRHPQPRHRRQTVRRPPSPVAHAHRLAGGRGWVLTEKRPAFPEKGAAVPLLDFSRPALDNLPILWNNRGSNHAKGGNCKWQWTKKPCIK